MTTIAERAPFDTLVTCPETGRLTGVWVDVQPDGVALCGCARFWGDLRCNGDCVDEAVAGFLASIRAAPPVYCGRPNEGSPRPREG